MRDVSFGQFYPANSPVHRLDPRTKLLLTIMYVIMIFFVRSFIVYGCIALLLVGIILLSKVPLLSALRSVRGVLFLVLFTSILNIFFYSAKESDTLLYALGAIKFYKEGLLTSARLAIRIVLLVTGSSVLTLTTTPVALTDGLEKLLAPLKLVRFPVHELALIMSIALKLIPNMIEETDKIMCAQRSRGADFDSKNLIKKARAMLPVLIPLFVSSFRRAEDLALAMDSRCYSGSKGRTKLKKLRLTLRDAIAFLLFSAIFTLTLFLYYNWLGWSFVLWLV